MAMHEIQRDDEGRPIGAKVVRLRPRHEPKRCPERMTTRDGTEYRCVLNVGFHKPGPGCSWGRDD